MIQSNSFMRQHGFNLIEIMVAMTIGLILILGTTTLYLRSKQTADVDDSLARLQETARYALSVIETDIRMANYWGLDKNGSELFNSNTKCTGDGFCAREIAANADPAYCGGAYVTDLPRYIEGTDNQFNAVLPCPGNKGNISLSADTVTVRRASTITDPAPIANTLQVCSTGTGAITVSMNNPCPSPIGQLHSLLMNLYYISTQSDGSTTVPSLRRIRLTAGPGTQDQEVVAGVEDMQIQFGWDSTSTTETSVRAQPQRYLDPANPLLTDTTVVPTAPNGRVLSVKIWLLIRSETADPAFTDTQTYRYANRVGAAVNSLNNAGARGMQYQPNDGFHRLLVSKTIFLRNATGT